MVNLYPKLASVIQPATTLSNWVSVLALLTMAGLVTSELLLVLRHDSPRGHARVEPHRADEIVAHLDLQLLHVGCSAVKIFQASSLQSRSREIERWTDQFSFKDAGERGCRIKGALRMPKLPGSIQVAAVDTKGKPNLSHKVHHLAFTDEEDAPDSLKLASGFGNTRDNLEGFSGTDIFSAVGPIDQEEGIHTSNLNHEYNLQLVPTITADEQRSYQYMWTEATWKPEKDIAGITFHLELSPITMRFHHEQLTAYERFINVAAILGGVYVMFIPLGMLA